MSTKINNKKFVLQLIEEYKALPSLWQVDCASYKSKYMKRSDYNVLLNKMKLLADPCVTMEEIKKKIAKMRTCYRRELKKVADSIKSGATGADVYIPTLWYFNQINFLRNQEIIKTKEPKDDDFVIDADCDAVDDESGGKWMRAPEYVKTKPKSTHFEKSFVKKNTFLKRPTKRPVGIKSTTKKDEAALFSETWAVAFRKLSYEQQLYSKRCIDEVLYQGQLGKLTDSSYKCIEMTLPDPSSIHKFDTDNNFMQL